MANPFQLPEITVTPDNVTPQPPPPDTNPDVVLSDPNVGGSNPNATSSTGTNAAVVPGATLAQNTSPGPQLPLDPSNPRFNPDIVDDSGLPIDLWANPQAKSKTSNPQGNTPVLSPNASQPTPQAQSAPDQDPADIKEMQDTYTGNVIVANKTMGGFSDLIKGVGKNFLDTLINPALKTGSELGAIETAANPMTPSNVEQASEAFLRDPSQQYMDGNKLFDMMGIPHGVTNTYLNDAGQATLQMFATSVAIRYGIGVLANKLWASGLPMTSSVARAVAIGAQKFTDAAASDPARWLASEVMGGWGAVAGGEDVSDYARQHGAGAVGSFGSNVAGSILGAAVGGGPASAITVKTAKGVMSVGKLFARQLLDATDATYRFLGGKGIGDIPAVGRVAPRPAVDPQTLANAKALETAHRTADNNLMQARQNYANAVEGTPAWNTARLALNDAKVAEKDANLAAQTAWDALPAGAKGDAVRQVEAIRSQFAKTEYPTTFAQSQVQAETQDVKDQVADVFHNLQPDDLSQGTEGYSAKISDGLWFLRQQGKGRLTKYWDRTTVDQPLRDRGAFQQALTRFGEGSRDQRIKDMPTEVLNNIQERLANFADAPTLNYIKQEMSGLHQDADIAYAAGNRMLGANYDRLHSELYQAVSEAYPDNVPLQQAREASKDYFDLFARRNTGLGQYLRTTREGVNSIRKEDILKTLVRSAHGLDDVARAAEWLEKKGVVNIRDPAYVTKDQQAGIDALKDNIANGIKAHIQETMQQQGYKEKDAIKLLSNPAFQRRIQSVAPALAQVQQASHDLSAAMAKREAIESSAVAKYLEMGDPEVAYDKIWRSNDPTSFVKALVSGNAGIGGMAQDPIAMQGLKGGLLQKLIDSVSKTFTSGTFKGQIGIDFSALQNSMQGRHGQMLKSLLSSDEYKRLNKLILYANSVETDAIKHEGSIKAWKKIAELGALRFQHKLPFHPEGGAKLKYAGMVSGIAGNFAENIMRRVPAGILFRRAISNPHFEEFLYGNLPIDSYQVKAQGVFFHRAMRLERAIVGTYRNWWAYGNGPGPHADQAPNADPLSWIEPTSAQAGEVIPFPGYPGDAEARMLTTQSMKNKIAGDNPNKSPASINNAFDQVLGIGGKGATIHLGPGAAP